MFSDLLPGFVEVENIANLFSKRLNTAFIVLGVLIGGDGVNFHVTVSEH